MDIEIDQTAPWVHHYESSGRHKTNTTAFKNKRGKRNFSDLHFDGR